MARTRRLFLLIGELLVISRATRSGGLVRASHLPYPTVISTPPPHRSAVVLVGAARRPRSAAARPRADDRVRRDWRGAGVVAWRQ
ncbi:MAG: hypothetical protein QM736_08875 [Vicinamibacterales bacterium]